MARRHTNGYYGETGKSDDPFDIDKDFADEFNDFNGPSDNYRRALIDRALAA